jgi:hypothetical protein
MSLTHHVAQWIEEQPERCALLAQLRERFDPKRLESALQQCRRRGLLEHRRGVWHRTSVSADGLPPPQVLRTDLDGYDLQVSLRLADERFAKAIGAARYEDIPVIRPAARWRQLPPPSRGSLVGSSAAMCAAQQPEMHDYQQSPRSTRVDRNIVRRMTEAGMSQRAIAARLGVLQSEIARAVRDLHLGLA